jgi:hypothetical protein
MGTGHRGPSALLRPPQRLFDPAPEPEVVDSLRSQGDAWVPPPPAAPALAPARPSTSAPATAVAAGPHTQGAHPLPPTILDSGPPRLATPGPPVPAVHVRRTRRPAEPAETRPTIRRLAPEPATRQTAGIGQPIRSPDRPEMGRHEMGRPEMAAPGMEARLAETAARPGPERSPGPAARRPPASRPATRIDPGSPPLIVPPPTERPLVTGGIPGREPTRSNRAKSQITIGTIEVTVVAPPPPSPIADSSPPAPAPPVAPATSRGTAQVARMRGRRWFGAAQG